MRSINARRLGAPAALVALALAGCTGSRLTPEDRALIDRVADAGKAVHPADPRLQSEVPGTDADADLAPAGRPLSLDVLVAAALARNPEVKAAEARLAAAKAKIPQAGALADPRVGVAFDDVPVRTADPTEGDRQGFVMQDLPFPGKLGLRADVAEKEAAAVAAALAAKERDVVAEVKKAFYELYAAERALAIQEEQIKLVEQFVAIAQTKYETGKATQQDLLKAQVELLMLQNDLLMLQAERATARVDLNRVLYRPAQAQLGLTPETPVEVGGQDLAALRRAALERRPELRAAWAEVEKSAKARELAEKNRNLPDFTVEWRYMSSRGEMEDRWMGGLSLNLPWFNPMHAYEVKETRAMAAASRSELLATRSTALAGVESGFAKVETSRRLVQLFRTSLLPQAEQALAAAQKGYETDRVDFLSLVDSERALRGIKLSYHRTMAQLGQQFAELERAVGSELPPGKNP